MSKLKKKITKKKGVKTPQRKKTTKKKAPVKYTTRQKRKSKVTRPDESAKPAMVAVRVPQGLKRLLEDETNASETIITALELYYGLYKICPRCKGSGKVPR